MTEPSFEDRRRKAIQNMILVISWWCLLSLIAFAMFKARELYLTIRMPIPGYLMFLIRIPIYGYFTAAGLVTAIILTKDSIVSDRMRKVVDRALLFAMLLLFVLCAVAIIFPFIQVLRGLSAV